MTTPDRFPVPVRSVTAPTHWLLPVPHLRVASGSVCGSVELSVISQLYMWQIRT